MEIAPWSAAPWSAVRRAGIGVAVAFACQAAARAQPAQGTLASPVSPTCISSPFGPRILPGKPLAGTYHYGIDLAAPVGAPVRAAAAGAVVSIHKRGPGGLEVVLRHGDPQAGGYLTLYAHLGSVTPALAEGRRMVAREEKIGVVGRTGVSYGPHVYFELRAGTARIDPEPILGVPRCRQPRGTTGPR